MNQKKRKKMNKTNKSHKAFTVKKDTSPWHLASPPSHPGGASAVPEGLQL
jgi:hypothetical protein